MQAVLYNNFSKRINSTKQPTGGTSVDVRLKEATSSQSPTLILRPVNGNVNYVAWNSAYYFVSNCNILSNGLMALECTKDVLATYKSQIANTTAFVAYSATGGSSMITDDRISATQTSTSRTVKSSGRIFRDDRKGAFVITVATSDSSATVGLTCMYGISSGNLKELTSKLYTASFWDELKKTFNDPYTALIDCHYVPFHVPTEGDKVKIGHDETDIVAGGLKLDLNNMVQDVKVTCGIPRINGDFRDFAPYSTYRLYLPMYGVVDIDPGKLTGASALNIQCSKDVRTGMMTYTVKANKGGYLATYTCDVGIPLAVGQTNMHRIEGAAHVAGGATAAIGSVASFVGTGGVNMGAIGGAIGGITTMGKGIVTAFTEDSSGRGVNGAFSAVSAVLNAPAEDVLRYAALTQFTHVTSAAPSSLASVQGRPVMAVQRIGSHSGYVQTQGASVDIPGSDEDKTAVNAYLNQGIFLE